MARIQPLPQAALPQYEPIFQLIAGLIEPALVQLVAHVASAAAGCQCCQAHTATHAHHLGVDTDKIAGVWMFETHELFSGAERAALRLARDAAHSRSRTACLRHTAPRGARLASRKAPTHPGVVADFADGSSSTTTGQVGSQS